MKRFCECGNHVVVFAHIRKHSTKRGQLKVFSAKGFYLCQRHAKSLYQSLYQRQKFPALSAAQNARVEMIYLEC